jgi:hypothetical protein
MRSITVTPAYGADYKSKKDALTAWNAGKDFVIRDYKLRGYVNNADAKTYDITSVTIRYNKETRCIVVPISH